MSSKQIRSGAKAPGHRRHIVGRLMGYIKRGYKARSVLSPTWRALCFWAV